MIARLAADAVLLVHVAFIAFVLAGAALVVRDARWAFVHVPAVVWAAYAELTATICPLTPLENELRRRAGAGGYEGGFVEHYVIPLVYPAGLTPDHQRWLGVAVVGLNLALYAWAWRRLRARREGRRESR
jgi:hypothetical protein